MVNHTSAFQFQKLFSNENPFKTLSTSSGSSACICQLVSLSEMEFLFSRTSLTMSALISIGLKASHVYL